MRLLFVPVDEAKEAYRPSYTVSFFMQACTDLTEKVLHNHGLHLGRGRVCASQGM
jgi:hypothetical protein